MHTVEKKARFWKEHKKVGRIRNIYRVLGYVMYPFILRSKVREKINKGKASWWTKQLWYMLNDDEIARYGVDYDIKLIKEKKPNYNLETSWGRFKASYWFNALRNSGYNYMMANPPVNYPVTSYDDLEYTINEIWTGKAIDREKVEVLVRAEWVKIDGEISMEHSRVGEGEVWYHPNEDESVSLCRYSKAYIKKFLFWNLCITLKKGEFNGGRKYDTHIKLAKIERR